MPTKPESRTVPALLDEMARHRGDAPFLIDGTRRWSYAAFQGEARRFALGLRGLGVGTGDKVAILMGNKAEWLIADFAILMLGAVMVSINTWTTRRELAYQLNHSDTRMMITQARFLGHDYPAMVREIREGGEPLPLLEHVVVFGDKAAEQDWDAVMTRGAGGEGATVAASEAAIRPDDVAYILYTSGSTSTPKGVQLVHSKLIDNMWDIGERMHIRPDDRLWLAVSLFWGLGCENALFAVMTHGAAIVLQESFEAGEALRLIEAERCTLLYATPNMASALLDHPDRARRDISSLRAGGTIGTPEQIAQVAKELGATEVSNLYGLTESYGNAAVADAHDPLEVRMTSVGRPLPGFDLIIVDPETGQRRPAGEIGEIRLKGNVSPGYFKDADKNAEAFDDQGYFKTGDLGFLDADRRLYFRGRIKEMIKTGGINVAPLEVEEILAEHPGIEQVFVVGVPDPLRDEIVVAVVVGAAEESALRDRAREALAAYKRPRAYRFIAAAELPLTSTGKVQKAALPALFADDVAETG